MALYHYLLIPHEERHKSTWNNLGYVRDKLKLPANSVKAYKKAAELGETLAMSNLAYKYIRGGFLEDAKAQCDRALATPSPHKSIWGRSVVATVSHKRVDAPESLLLSAGSDKRALLIISEDGQTIEVREVSKGQIMSAYELKASAPG